MGKRREYNPNSYNALDAAIAFIIILIVFEVLQRIVTPIARTMRENDENFDYYLFLCIDTLLSQGVIILIALFFSRSRNVSLFSGGGFVYKFDIVHILFAVLLTFGIYFTVSFAHMQFDDNLYKVFYQIDMDTYYEILESELKGNEGFALLYVYVLVPLLPCVCEEIFFRGIIMRGLRQFGVTFSIIVASICFALMHGNFEQLVLQFVLGLAIASVVTLTGNLLLGAAMHFANNFFTTVFAVTMNAFDLDHYLGSEFTEAILILFGVVCLVVSATFFINLLIGKVKRSAQERPEQISIKDSFCYARIRREDETVWQTVYPVQVNFSMISDGTYLYERRGKEKRINKRSNDVVSLIFLIIGIITAVVLIFISI